MEIPQCFERLEELRRQKNRVSEKMLEEILEIAEGQEHMTPPQILIFASTMEEYDGLKKQIFIERYAHIGDGGNWREDCYGI